jgi:hypothetical protein
MLPFVEEPATDPAGAAPHLCGQHLSRDASALADDDAGKNRSIRNTRASALQLRTIHQQQRLDDRTQDAGHERSN